MAHSAWARMSGQRRCGHPLTPPRMEEDGVERRAEDVVLVLVEGAVLLRPRPAGVPRPLSTTRLAAHADFREARGEAVGRRVVFLRTPVEWHPAHMKFQFWFSWSSAARRRA